MEQEFRGSIPVSHKYFSRIRTRETQVIPWSLADGRRQKHSKNAPGLRKKQLSERERELMIISYFMTPGFEPSPCHSCYLPMLVDLILPDQLGPTWWELSSGTVTRSPASLFPAEKTFNVFIQNPSNLNLGHQF